MSAIMSMTGFGCGDAENENSSVRIDIKSVNHRGQKINVRSRPGLGPFEKNLRDQVSARLSRGAIDINVTVMRKFSLEQAPMLEELATSAVETIRHLAAKLNLSGEVMASDLVHIPGLFETGVTELVDESEWLLLEKATAVALEQMEQMRSDEGRATAERLLEIVQPVEDFRIAATARAPEVVERQRKKLRDRLAELEVVRSADEQALERELVFFADRVDINEEMDRLTSHVEQFRAAINSGGEIGKKLEFLGQEMLREVNTTASKANDVEITRQAVEAKMAVEKIKEQSANLE